MRHVSGDISRQGIPALRTRASRGRPAVLAGFAGFAYIEVLIATLLIMVTLLPALQALQPGVAGAGIHRDRLADHHRLAGKLEDVLAQPFADLDAAAIAAGSRTIPSSYSDNVTHPDGRLITRNVYLSLYDGDNADADNDPFTGTDAGLMWVRVEIDGTADALETLTSD